MTAFRPKANSSTTAQSALPSARGHPTLTEYIAQQGAAVEQAKLTGAKEIRDRLLARYFEAAETVFLDGSTPWEVDEAMEEFGFAMGPFEAQDLMGIDVVPRLPAGTDGRREIPLLQRMLELGKLGKKAGAGWYRYPGGGGKVDDPIVADLAIEESHFAGRKRTDYDAETIRQRLVLALINEAAEILRHDNALSSAEVDMISLNDLGFPKERGGLMQFADHLGATSVVEDLRELQREDPVAWRVSPLLVALAEQDKARAEGADDVV